MDISSLKRRIEATGLSPRGSLYPGREDLDLLGEEAAHMTLILIGHVGRSLEAVFAGGELDPELADPLDSWTRTKLTEIAQEFEARALFPFDGPPFLPFLRWAARAEHLSPSPLGMLIHPEYGLWHGYRGALLLPARLAPEPYARGSHPCDSCKGRPCLTACPVHAFKIGDYDVRACRDHIRSPRGTSCLTDGCLARRACPAGTEHSYGPAQMRFHMRHFAEHD